MNLGYIGGQIHMAVDLLQIITEDMEDNFLCYSIPEDVKARATMTVSALYVLTDYLRDIGKEKTV